MTVIIGLEHNGQVYMGGDSMASNGWGQGVTALRKVFRVGPFLIGYTSSFRMGQILQYHLEVRPQELRESDEQYMVAAFIEAVRDCLSKKGYTQITNNREASGDFLVGYRSKLYYVASDFQVNRYAMGLAAVGCGDNYALGAMLAMAEEKPRKRILKAMKIAEQCSTGVCAPFHIEKLPKGKGS